MEHPARACLAEIVAHGAEGAVSRGSGYLVASGWVLTAAHVVSGAQALAVWLGAPAELDTADGHGVAPASVRVIAGTDLALLPVPEAATPPGYVRPLLARLDRDQPEPVPAVAAGFPWFKLREAPDRPEVELREVQYATGRIAGAANAKTGTLEFAVASAPASRSDDPKKSPWEGMSGGPLFVNAHLVAVIGKHFLEEGLGTLTARPLHLADDAASRLGLPVDPVRHEWSALLPQLGQPLPVLTAPTRRQLSARRAHAAAQQWLPDDGVLVARDRELASLDAFASGGQQWRWITAHAFAGKTALLAYFALHPPEAVDVVACFLRATTGENTAAYALKLLNEQLAGLHDVRPGYVAPLGLPDLRFDFAHDLLRAAADAARQTGRPLLIMIDGLDEYATTEELALHTWLPDSLPEGVSLLVTSRSGVAIDLPRTHPLRTEAARGTLDASEAASQLRDLAMQELERALLSGEELTYQVAGCLAATDGRISLADLNAWLVRRGTRRAQDSAKYLADHVRAWFYRSIQTTEDPNGSEQQVLVFAHEALRQAYRDSFVSELPVLREELHDWADHCQRDGWPSSSPLFLLTGYPRLLASLRDTQRLTPLVLDTIRHNRLRSVTGTDHSALQQIRTTHQLQLDEPEIDLLTLGRLSIHRTRLEARAGNVPDTLPAVWARLGQLGRAINTASAITDPTSCSRALTAVAEALVNGGHTDRAGQVADEARQVADTITEDGYRAPALIAIAEAQARAGRPDLAQQFADEVRQLAAIRIDRPDPSMDLAAVAVALAKAGHPGQAQQVADPITDPYHRARTLAAISVALARAGHPDQAQQVVDEARQAADTITYPSQRSEALTAIAEALAQTNDPDKGQQVADEARQAADTIDDPWARSRALTGIAGALAQTNDPDKGQQVADEARQAADTVDDPLTRSLALTAVAGSLVNAGHAGQAQQTAGEARQVAGMITEPDHRSWALKDVAVVLAKSGHPDKAQQVADEARRVADTISDPRSRSRELTAVANALVDAGHPGQARQTAEDAQQIADTILAPDARWEALADVAEALVDAGHPGPAQQVAEQARGVADTVTHSRSWALARIAVIEANAGDPGKARQVADAITDPSHRSWALTTIAVAHARSGHPDLAQQATDEARQVANTITFPFFQREEALMTIAETLAKAGYPGQAQQVADTITDPGDKARTLRTIAEAQARAGHPDLAQQFAEQARQVGESIVEPYYRSLALIVVAETLADAGQPDRAKQVAAEARQVAETITDPDDKVRALTTIAEAQAKAGHPDLAQQVADEVRQVAATMTNPYPKSTALTAIVEALTRAGYPDLAQQFADEVRQVAATITDPYRSSALATVAVAMAKAGHPGQAQQVADPITNPGDRARAFAAISVALAQAGRPDQAQQVADQAQRIADTITNPDHRSQTHAGIIEALTNAGLQGLAARALGRAWLSVSWVTSAEEIAKLDAHILCSLAEDELR